MGPETVVAQEIQAEKHRLPGESFKEACARQANALKDNDEHFRNLLDIFYGQRFLAGGRVQAAMGAPRRVTPYNCFVSGTIPDSMDGIMRRLSEAAETMRMGGGIGYDFSTLRPRGDHIRTLDSKSSGPISFMSIFDALCGTIASSGHRRGAQMGVLRVDHPDIEEFVRAKQNRDKLTSLNISVGITDDFMWAVHEDAAFDLRFEGRTYRTIRARDLWEEIMRSTWQWAEPGVLFLDIINRENNLWYCERIAATNPCGEQPLPPYGACLLGSFNLVKYIHEWSGGRTFFWDDFRADIPEVVRAMDNVIDRATYPLAEQEQEAKAKRRMGLGVCGLANAAEALGLPYGSEGMLGWTREVLEVLRNDAYKASSALAVEKGAFPLWDTRLLESGFMQRMPEWLRKQIATTGLRNSHLTSIAPTGTISLGADNVSGGIEPPFALEYQRVRQTFDGPEILTVQDYAYRKWGVQGRTATECTGMEHVDVLCVASEYMDSAVSKTCNVSPDMPWEHFKGLYMRAWEGGAKGCTTFNPDGERFGILTENTPVVDVQACYINPETGERSCE